MQIGSLLIKWVKEFPYYLYPVERISLFSWIRSRLWHCNKFKVTTHTRLYTYIRIWKLEFTWRGCYSKRHGRIKNRNEVDKLEGVPWTFEKRREYLINYGRT